MKLCVCIASWSLFNGEHSVVLQDLIQVTGHSFWIQIPRISAAFRLFIKVSPSPHMKTIPELLIILDYNMASTHSEEQSAYISNSQEGTLPIEPPLPLIKGTYPEFPYYTCKNGVKWFKTPGGSVTKKEGLDAWKKYRNQRNERGEHPITAELPGGE